jgi:hypothetical protein
MVHNIAFMALWSRGLAEKPPVAQLLKKVHYSVHVRGLYRSGDGCKAHDLTLAKPKEVVIFRRRLRLKDCIASE